MFRHLESRVAKALVHLAESVGLHGVRGPSVEIHVCQRELGGRQSGKRQQARSDSAPDQLIVVAPPHCGRLR